MSVRRLLVNALHDTLDVVFTEPTISCEIEPPRSFEPQQDDWRAKFSYPPGSGHAICIVTLLCGHEVYGGDEDPADDIYWCHKCETDVERDCCVELQ